MSTFSIGGAPPQTLGPTQPVIAQGESGGTPLPPQPQSQGVPQLNFQMPAAPQLPTPQMPQQPQFPSAQTFQPAPQQQPQPWQPQYQPQPTQPQFQVNFGAQQAQPAQTTQQASTAIRDSLVARGLANAAAYPNDEQLLADLARGAQEVIQARGQTPYTRLGYEQALAAASGNGGANGSGNGQQPNPGNNLPNNAPTSPAPQKQKAPEWREEWASFVQVDPSTGMYRLKNEFAGVANPLIAERANEYAQWRRNRNESLVRDPLKFIQEEGLDQHIEAKLADVEKKIESKIRQEQRALQEQAIATEFHDQIESVVYQRDQTGKVARGLTGEPIMSPIGEAVTAELFNYNQRFMATYGHKPAATDLVEHARSFLAMNGVSLGGNAATPSPQQTVAYLPQQPVVQSQPYQYGAQYTPQATFAPQFQPQQQGPGAINRAVALAQAQYTPSAAGTVAAAAQNAAIPQNAQTSLKDMLRQGATARGISTEAFSY